MENQIRLLQALFNSCKNSGSWELRFVENKPYTNFIDALLELEPINRIGDFDFIHASIQTQFDDPALQSLDNIDEDSCRNLIENVERDLQANIANHWVVVSVSKASLEKNLKIGKHHLITGNEDQKVKKLSQIAGISLKEAKSRASHTKKSRSKYFFSNPLLLINIENQTSIVESLALKYTAWLCSLIKVIYWAKFSLKQDYQRIFISAAQHSEIEHIMIYAKDSWRFSHRAFYFKNEIKLMLDFLDSYYYRKILSKIFEEIVVNTDPSLKYRILKAIRFFNKSLEYEKSRDNFEGIGMATTMLMIAAEALIFEKSQEIKSKLSVVLPELCLPTGMSKADCAKALKQTYEWRCDLVHNADDTWKSGYQNSNEEQVYNNAKRTIANLIYQASIYVLNFNEPNSNMEKQWFKNIQSIWDKRIGWI